MLDKKFAADLAAGKDDSDMFVEATKVGLISLACAHEGIPFSTELKTTDFSRQNPWAHLARSDKAIESVEREVPRSSKPGNETIDASGNVVLGIERVYKGE